MSKTIYVQDGDVLIVIGKLQPSAHDPALQTEGVIQSFRVICNSMKGPILKLVAEQDHATALSRVPKADVDNNR
jgi:hypothetical protein